MYRYVMQRSCGKLSTNILRGYATRRGGLPPMREAGLGKVIFILSPFAVVGGVATYANYDKDFRKTVEENVPGSGAILKVIFQEEDLIGDMKRKVDSVTSSVTGLFGSSSEPVKEEKPKPPPVTRTPGSVTTASKAAPALPEIKAPPKAAPAKKADAEIPKPVVAPALPKDIQELSVLVEKSAATAVKEYQKAVTILHNYKDEVHKIVENAGNKLDASAWTTLKNKTSARDAAVKLAEGAAIEARQAIENIEKALYKNDIPADSREPLKTKIRNFLDNLDHAKTSLYRAYEASDLTEKYWSNVESARNDFIRDIEELFPNVNFSQKKLNLSKEDIDLFLVYAHSRYLAVQREVQRLHSEGETLLRRELDKVHGGGDSVANKAEVDYELKKVRREIEEENHRKMFKMTQLKEKELNDYLKRQLDLLQEHETEKLQLKELEMRRRFERELEEKLSMENENYKTELATMIGKLRGMDDALKARAETERSAQQAQHLWGACQALWASVRVGQPGVSWKENLRPLKTEIKAVEIAAEGDALVAAVIEGLPNVAIKRGVYPEDALRESFIRVDQVARRLAFVPESGARLPVYILSYLQSMLIVTPSNPISKDELQDKAVDFAQFDNNDVLNRAKYWVERGNLTQALKYMNLLKGAARDAASEWITEARLLLETQQAANTLMAHAAANSQRYL